MGLLDFIFGCEHSFTSRQTHVLCQYELTCTKCGEREKRYYHTIRNSPEYTSDYQTYDGMREQQVNYRTTYRQCAACKKKVKIKQEKMVQIGLRWGTIGEENFLLADGSTKEEPL